MTTTIGSKHNSLEKLQHTVTSAEKDHDPTTLGQPTTYDHEIRPAH